MRVGRVRQQQELSWRDDVFLSEHHVDVVDGGPGRVPLRRRATPLKPSWRTFRTSSALAKETFDKEAIGRRV